MKIHPTHIHILNLISNFSNNNNQIKVLDSGCGTGKLMKLFLDNNFDIHGYDISDLHKTGLINKIKDISELLIKQNRVKIISLHEKLPFDNNFFDYVVSNQVVEHVKDIKHYIEENLRVLKPGGKLILCFPTKEIIIEPHIKLPFLHILPKKFQFLYLYFFYKFDYKMAQERFFYIQNNCFYRKLDYFRSLDTSLLHDFSFTSNLFYVKFPIIKKYFSFFINRIPVYFIAKLTSITVVYTKK